MQNNQANVYNGGFEYHPQTAQLKDPAISTQQSVDYGDIPQDMDEEQMRKYLALESKIVLPTKKRDSFEDLYSQKRQQYTGNAKQSSGTHPTMNHEASQSTTTNVSQQYPNSMRKRTSQDTTYTDATNYSSDRIDRMSTVTIISNKPRHKKNLSFRKEKVTSQVYNYNVPPQVGVPPPPPSNNAQTNGIQTYNDHDNNQENTQNKEQTPPPFLPPPPVKSNLTAKIQTTKPRESKKMNSSNIGVSESRNPDGTLVVKQLPYSKKTHIWCNVYVEISDDNVVHLIVHFLKHYSVMQFLSFLKNETSDGAFKKFDCELYIADEDGDLNDDFPQPELTATVTSIMQQCSTKHFYIQIKAAQTDTNENNDQENVDISFNDDDGDDDGNDGSDEDVDNPKTSGNCCVVL